MHSASCLVFLGKLKKEALLGFLHRGLSPHHSFLSRPGRQLCQRKCPQDSLMRLSASSAHSLAFPCQATHLQASRGSQLNGVLPRATLEVLSCCKAPWPRERGACAGLAPCTASLYPWPSTPLAQIQPPAVLALSTSHWVLTHAALPRGSRVSAPGLAGCTTRLAIPELGKEAAESHQCSRQHPETCTNLSSSSPAGWKADSHVVCILGIDHPALSTCTHAVT